MFDISQHIAKPNQTHPIWAGEILALPAVARFFDAWKKAKGSKRLPSPKDLPPEKLIFCMPDITVTERLGPEHIRYRLVGTGVISRLGFNPTDKNMYDLTPAQHHPMIKEVYSAVLATPAALVSLTSNTLSSGIIRQVSSLHLPMINHDGEANRILNLHIPEDPQGYPAYQGPRDVTEISSEIKNFLLLPF